MNKFFDKVFFEHMKTLIAHSGLRKKESAKDWEMIKTARTALQEKAKEYRGLFKQGTIPEAIAGEIRTILAADDGNSILLDNFFTFYPETLAQIPKNL